MKERKLVTEYYKKDGKIYCKDVWKEVEKEPMWGDNWRATLDKLNNI